MITAQFEFPAGRFHATPWDRQVNEGEVEWPPSPWRILRALVATWHRKIADNDRLEADGEQLQSVVKKLARTAPDYHVPSATAAHTRHFMPIGKERYRSGKGKLYIEKTSQIFDPFVHVEAGGSLFVGWPGVELDEGERQLLDGLLRRMNYLGRAESWTEARLVTPGEAELLEFNCQPESRVDESTGQNRSVDLLAPVQPAEYEDWREEQRERHAERILAEKRRKDQNERITSANRRNIEEATPETFFGAVTCETSLLEEYGWNQPPGSRWIRYQAPPIDSQSDDYDAAVRTMEQDETSSEPRGPTVARMKVHSNAVPSLTDAVAVANKVRVALMSNGDAGPVFAGRDDDGPLKGHRHNHVLVEALDQAGKISHLVLWAPMGFDEPAQKAISQTTKVWDNDGPVEFDVQTILLGFGEPEDFGGINRTAGESTSLAEAKTWKSRTPFVPTRHEKPGETGEHGYTVGSPAHDLLRLLGNRDHLPPIEDLRALSDVQEDSGGTVDLYRKGGSGDDKKVDPVAGTRLGGKPVRWLDFRTIRPDDRGQRSSSRGYGFEVEFAEPTRGPVCAGYAAHFGLGRFEPVNEGDTSSN